MIELKPHEVHWSDDLIIAFFKRSPPKFYVADATMKHEAIMGFLARTTDGKDEVLHVRKYVPHAIAE